MHKKEISRRKVLRGLLQGSAVSVGLPMLDLFLNENGTAMADGSQLPVCFGTWFWALGLSPGQWEPKGVGSDFELGPQLAMLEPIKSKINLFTDTQIFLDGKANLTHMSTIQGIVTGHVSDFKESFARSIDDLVAEKLGVHTRFPAITVSCDGNPAKSFSARGGSGTNPAEISPLALYQRIFGSGFIDPNAADFTPDPAVMLRKSALSAVTEERQQMMKAVGATDRQQLDEFFTSLRDLEQKLALELEKPQPMPACTVPSKPEGEHPSLEINDMMASHDLFSRLIAHALACGQTRIFNVTLSADAVRAGDTTEYHSHTHQEVVDAELGYQPMCYWYAQKYMTAFRDMVQVLDSIKEGDSTLLDRTLMLGYTDHGYARWHSLQEMPVLTAGSAGGGMKTGMHIATGGAASSRVGFTCQKALGLWGDSWGTGSNEVREPFSEVLA